ncbi:MAG: hypothetical protein UT41_C0001G0234 [Candidatus Wolfebacteria bacterium GW2011_GWC2_39_22]|uniref:Uncharacterized protein n=1 Tax=Candidatus Wolfebacteria bacterium GW2011_GWC2_39_22 TaxID=1619013 RepID=A0A0G0QQP2_9BACT|nr:MAG: hypothetical protein UT41_C0001G0234 [Candidatus Wolfebacteria bacterium GW2011_GWC2_39_22]HBI25646.1 hypothetical protein [Candidatus Wolfebacteria bacterium]
MNSNQVKEGISIKTTALKSTKGMLVKHEYLAARKAGATGIVMGFVPGHGGDVWWIKHEDGSIGAYCFNEFKSN